jgi:hypothetical protein
VPTQRKQIEAPKLDASQADVTVSLPAVKVREDAEPADVELRLMELRKLYSEIDKETAEKLDSAFIRAYIEMIAHQRRRQTKIIVHGVGMQEVILYPSIEGADALGVFANLLAQAPVHGAEQRVTVEIVEY